MMRSKWFFLLVATLATASLWGCGSSGGSGGSAVTPTDSQPQAVGSDSCIVCHGNNVAFVLADWTTSIHNAEGVGCESCHGNGGAHRGIGPIPYPSPSLEGQCAACHTDEASLARHAGDDPATATVIEGYVMRDVEPEGCRDCHGDAHDVVAGGINEQWAQSGHAGRIATDAPDTETVWGHYDWDTRASCARCHTTTGIMNFLNAPDSYDAANNDFSHLEEGQNELLYCWGCHSDTGTGALRNPGAISEEYNADDDTTAADEQVLVNYPDVASSNVCMGCHLGRETGDVIKVDADDDGDRSFINSHYLAAGGMVFNEAGYEYGVYANYGYHQNVGVGNAQNTGTAGPCVTCHMSSADPHKFDVVEKDATGVIAAVTSTVCANCHAGLTPAALESTKEEFHHALVELEEALAEVGIYYYGAHPYFYSAPYVVGGTNTAYTDWASVYGLAAWKDVMGAAFNYNLIHHDPGAYAHNAEYSLQLIADSIDFISDGVLDGDSSIAAELLAKGINVGDEDSYANLVHATPVTAAVADPAGSEATCSACHAAAPHYGGAFGGNAQFVAHGAVCADCHAGGDISANGDILAGYANSGHGDVASSAWASNGSHDWPTGSCKACHSSTGFIDLATGSVTVASAGVAGQTLACDACHSDVSTGALNVTGAMTLSYTYNTVAVTLPDVGNSNVCGYCHGGRGNTDSIEDASQSSRFEGHHAPTAGMLFSEITHIGYEYPGLDYTDRSFFRHDRIGADVTGDADAASFAELISLIGTEVGPCVGCHMPDSDHAFSAIEENEATGEIVAITAQAVCDACHSDMTPTVLEEESAGYQNAAALLSAYVANTVTNYQGAAVDNNSAVKGDYGAFQNAKIASEDPAAYTHNRYKVKRLIFDSIDWLDNGVIDGTITINDVDLDGDIVVDDLTEARAWLRADATTHVANRP